MPDRLKSTHDSERAARKLNLVRERWNELSPRRRVQSFRGLPRELGEDLFLNLKANDQSLLLCDMTPSERRSYLRLLPPDDMADVLQLFPPEDSHALLELLETEARTDVEALLAYAEDEAGGLMSPRFVRLRADMTTEVAIKYLRQQADRRLETLQYGYVLEHDQTLLGAVSFSQLLMAPGPTPIRELMATNLITVSEDAAQQDVTKIFSETGLGAIPVVDPSGHMKGIVTLDDAVHVLQEMATDEMQKMGGSEALDEPYTQIGFFRMVRKRAGWLTILFLGEMLTATAMGYFEKEIERAVVLALFIPLIISSGGNSGSQATSLIIRALALREIRLRDWWKVFVRELFAGLVLGSILGSIGLLRILLWPTRNEIYGPHYVLVGLTVAFSLVGIVLWGSLAGAMLPFILRRLGFDPATASAPFVATLVDVTGLVIYFSVASVILGGVLL